MLVDNRRVLERAAPRRWNLVALPIAVLLVAAVTSLTSRPDVTAAEPPPAGSDDDAFAPRPADEAPPENPFSAKRRGAKPHPERPAATTPGRWARRTLFPGIATSWTKPCSS